jgi:hypothetical protein
LKAENFPANFPEIFPKLANKWLILKNKKINSKKGKKNVMILSVFL